MDFDKAIEGKDATALVVRAASGSGKRAIMERVVAEWQTANPDATILVVQPIDSGSGDAAITQPPPTDYFDERARMPEAIWRKLYLGKF